ncbi:GtrA family protein [Patescibacteria group bacterium]|nr:GtrA family protein [Patescibacteria group bacterium]
MNTRVHAISKNRHARQFVKFVLVGGLSTVINFTIYATLVLNHVDYLLAATIAFIVATLNSYTWNRRWTFRAGPHRNERLVKFTLVQLIGLAINLLMLTFLIEHVGLEDHKLIAQLIANAFVIISNYIGNKFWTFKE